MLCRNPECEAELVPLIVTNMAGNEEHWKSGTGEFVYCCPNKCVLCQYETASKQKAMREKPKPRLPRHVVRNEP